MIQKKQIDTIRNSVVNFITTNYGYTHLREDKSPYFLDEFSLDTGTFNQIILFDLQITAAF